MSTPANNNRIVGVVLGFVFLIFSVFSNWAYLKNARANGTGFPMPVTVDGLHGSLGVAGLSLPIWLIVMLAAVSIVLVVLNRRGVTSLSPVLWAVPILVSAVYMGFGLSVVLSHNGGAVRIGFGLALVGAIVGLVSALRLDRTNTAETRRTV